MAVSAVDTIKVICTNWLTNMPILFILMVKFELPMSFLGNST